MEQKQSFQQKVLKQLDINLQRRWKSYIFQKNNTKYIIDLYAKQMIRHLEDNVGEYLDNLGYGSKILDITPKAWPMKEKS